MHKNSTLLNAENSLFQIQNKQLIKVYKQTASKINTLPVTWLGIVHTLSNTPKKPSLMADDGVLQ